MISFLQISPPKPCTLLSSPQYIPHAFPIFFSILSPEKSGHGDPPFQPVTSSSGKFDVSFKTADVVTIQYRGPSGTPPPPPLNLEDTGFKSRPDIGYYEPFSHQSYSFEANAGMEYQIRLKPLPSTYLEIHDSLTVHSFHNAAVSK